MDELLQYDEHGLLLLEQLDDLRPSQSEKLAQLQLELKPDIEAAPKYDELVGDVRLLRFLRASKYNVTESADMFRKMMTWRAAEGIDAVREEIVQQNLSMSELPGYESFVRYLPIRFYFALDYEGNPVCRDMLGQFDAAGAISEIGEEGLTRFWIYHQVSASAVCTWSHCGLCRSSECCF